MGFRAPDERTAELNTDQTCNREGTIYDICQEKKMNPRGTNLPKAERFNTMPFYCKQTGQSVFIGPGSYDPHKAKDKMIKSPCPTLIKPISLMDGKESGEQHYILVGHQIKYEPAWVLSPDHKRVMNGLNVEGSTRTLAGLNRTKLLANVERINQAKAQI